MMNTDKIKTVSGSKIEMRQMVMPNDTNLTGNLFGGKVMQWMDIAGGMSASKHSNSGVVTIGIDHFNFFHPINLGFSVKIIAMVTRVFSSSMEVKMTVFSEDFLNDIERRTHHAYYTYVAVDNNLKPRKIKPIYPETEEEKKEYEDAEFRRKLRLLLAGKLKDKKDVESCNVEYMKRHGTLLE